MAETTWQAEVPEQKLGQRQGCQLAGAGELKAYVGVSVVEMKLCHNADGRGKGKSIEDSFLMTTEKQVGS